MVRAFDFEVVSSRRGAGSSALDESWGLSDGDCLRGSGDVAGDWVAEEIRGAVRGVTDPGAGLGGEPAAFGVEGLAFASWNS